MSEVSKKITPNMLKSAAAVTAIGSLAIPLAEASTDSPDALAARSKRQIYYDSTQLKDQHLTFRPRPPRHHKRSPFTGYVVEGKTSTFGWPAEGGNTADGGNTKRPCIAIRDDSTLDHMFAVTLFLSPHHHPTENLSHCDWGPAARTGRAIDLTGEAVVRFGLSQANYPTGVMGVARELR